MLSVRDLARPGLEPVSFELGDGEAMALSGPSGAGKSMLLRALADLDPSAGEVRLDDVVREAMPAPEWRRRVAYLPAEAGWWADRVGDHFADRDRAAALVARLNLPETVFRWAVLRLSTGEKQRLALARLLLHAPRVLLLDEPTSGLDADNVAAVEAILAERLAAGAAMIVVTHDPAQARRLAGRRYRMTAGRFAEDAP